MQGAHSRSAKWQRYEAKYLISEAQAAEIRRYSLDHLPPDPHALHQPGYKYPILSVYLDSAARELLRHTLHKRVNRYKLRVRTYRDCNEPLARKPGFFEIKRRLNGIVQKTRARVPAVLAETLLWSSRAVCDGKQLRDRATQTNVNEFLHMRSRIAAQPAIGTYYMREAYEGVSAERIRITLDRDLHYGLLAPPGNGQRDMWWPVDAGGVILEIKFTNTYPFWVADMLRRVEVVRRGVCKYVICTRAAGGAAAQALG